VGGKIVSPPRIQHMTLFAHNGKLTAREFMQSQWMCNCRATGSGRFIT
jgi:predicted glutamine amidotransferase